MNCCNANGVCDQGKDCPVRKDCLEEGIRRNEWGWWGGVSAAERSVIRRRRGMAAIAHVRF